MSKEPSMEEILSSIKRIIAEEGDEIASPRAPRRGKLEVVPSEPEVAETAVDIDDEILELTPPTEAAHAEEEAPELPAEKDAETDEVLELAEPVETEAAEEPEVDLAEIEEPASEDAALEVADETSAAAVETETAAGVETEAQEPAPVAPEVLELTHEIDTEETVTLSNAAPSYSGAEPMISVESEVAARHSLSALSSMVVVPETGEGNTLEELVKAMLKPLVKEWLDARLPELVEGMVAKEISRITGGVR